MNFLLSIAAAVNKLLGNAFPIDKVAHHLAGAVIVGMTFVFGNWVMQLPVYLSALIGVALALAIGVTKECYDQAHPDVHTVEWLDAAATLAGAVYAAVVLVLFLHP